MNIGVVMRYILGASVIASGCILFLARGVEERESVKKILLGAAVGFAVVFATSKTSKPTTSYVFQHSMHKTTQSIIFALV